MGLLAYESLPEPGTRFTLGELLGTGVWANVYLAVDTQEGNKNVAIKIQSFNDEQRYIIEEEYRVLRDYTSHPNLPNFFGCYRNKNKENSNEIWFVLEYCGGGAVIDFICKLHAINKRLSEEHIAFILRELVSAVNHLHKNHIIHRDIRGSNLLLTTEGEIKLCDFGLSQNIKSTLGKRGTCIGSPYWMAPEVVKGSGNSDDEAYGSRADVWAVGITAIELGDGHPPFNDMHPTRAMFQILRNPPPTLYRPANWTQNYNDFIAECLEKNPENRPFMVELIEHPFFTELIGPTGSDHHLSCEIKHLLGQVADNKQDKAPKQEVAVVEQYIKRYNVPREKMYVEDLAALDKLTEESIVEELKQRLIQGDSYTFIGDVLLSINSNELPMEYSRAMHSKYSCKSRSENSPHIFSVADSAYQNMLHHEEHQQIIMAGESYSGKTTNLRHAIKHLIFLGEGNKNIGERVIRAQKVTHAFVNAGTPINPDSTRCVYQAQITFGQTGKLSGAIYSVYLLEKNRVSSTDIDQSNFHVFYYLYDYVAAKHELDKYQLTNGRDYRYLRIPESQPVTKLPYCRDDPDANVKKYEELEEHLKELDFSVEQLDFIKDVLAAIIILGNVRFTTNGDPFAAIENVDVAQKVASLLKLDDKKFQWALLNYCLIKNGSAEKRKHTLDEARDARDVLAGTLYSRLVDWIINMINQKLAFGRAIFGDVHVISITDCFGFECINRNRMDQLIINSLNEQLQYHFNQRMFVWEMIEQEEEQIPVTVFHYYDNKSTVDFLLLKPEGLFCVVDDATKGRHPVEYITDAINNKKSAHVMRVSGHEFSVAHYTGKITYDARELSDKNRDFVPPEMVETFRASENPMIKVLFTNLLSKTGNLTMAFDDEENVNVKEKNNKSRWGNALVVEKQRAKKLNTLSHGQYSQIHKMRTQLGVFRATCLELLKNFSVGSNSGNTHFVRCVRAEMDYKPRGFQTEMVYQQIRALSILDTATARQKGYPLRISFSEFLRRYKFLAFDFDENVDLTKDNCRLLLIRLKMEGWIIGNTKVFLKYYNVEYLSRLYETQVKKIIKVQSMMRAFLAKRNIATKLMKSRQNSDAAQKSASSEDDKSPSEIRTEAAVSIQKVFRGYRARRKYGPLLTSSGVIDQNTCQFIRTYAKKWKAKSIFQVLLLYRASKYQDLVNLTQQVHLFNQAVVCGLQSVNEYMVLERIDEKEINPALLGPLRPSVQKIPFKFDELPFFDTNFMCDPMSHRKLEDAASDDEPWDTPLKRSPTVSYQMVACATQSPCEQLNSNANSRVTFGPSTINGDHEPFKCSQCRRPMNGQSTVVEIEPIKPYSPHDHSVPIPKERTAPSIPKSNPADSSWINKPQMPSKSVNPVKELESLGRVRAVGSVDQNDDPPFNFQQMLRRTEHRRASMKRSIDEQNEIGSIASGYSSEKILPRYATTEKRDTLKPKQDFNYNDGAHIDQVKPLPRTRATTSNEMKANNNISVSSSLQDLGAVYTQEEIHPGVVLEGYAVDI